MLKSITKMFRVSAVAILAMLFLVEGMTAVSAQAFKPRSEARHKACDEKYSACLKSCPSKGCQANCGVDLIACNEAAQSDEEKAASKARDDKLLAEMQKAAAGAAKFDCAGRLTRDGRTEMVVYATNNTYRTLTCEVMCQYKGGDGKDGRLGCPKGTTVGPNLKKKEICANSSTSQPPPPFKVYAVSSGCH